MSLDFIEAKKAMGSRRERGIKRRKRKKERKESFRLIAIIGS